MTQTPQAAFTATLDHLSLWEVAHRWAGYSAPSSTTADVPSPVKDILHTMLRAQLASELCVAKANGVILKDWTYLSVEDFAPEDTDTKPEGDDADEFDHADAGMEPRHERWDGTEEHRRELYFDFMHDKLEPHNEATCDHADILCGAKPIDRTYLESVHVYQEDLARWALAQSLPFPDFWFTPAQRQALERDYRIRETVREQRENHQREGLTPPDDLYAQIVAADALAAAPPAEALPMRRLTESVIDQFWGRLASSQRHRLLCRAVAQTLWENDPTLKARDIVKHEVMREYGGAKYYANKDTVTTWIRDFDPRPSTSKTGPRKPK